VNSPDRPPMLLLAHRGASADAPENTLAAFELAVAQGADGVELDVQLCATGEVVVCHDEQLGRLAGVDRWVARTPLAELRAHDVGSRLGFAPAAIPLLAEVLEALPRRMVVNVELKAPPLADGGLAKATLEVIRRAGAEHRVVISSFSPHALAQAARHGPQVRRGYLLDPARSFWLHGRVLAPALSNHSVHPHHTACTPERVAHSVALGLEVAAWTVDDAAIAARLARLGVRYCITNRPGALRAEFCRTQ
jgi:glycerophosphoryl diester phosphodiesterase